MTPAAPIFVWSHLDSRAREHLCAATHGERLHFANKFAPAPGDEAAFRDAEICFGNVPAEWLGCAPRLRWMQLESVGFDYYRKLDRTRLAPGFVLTNLHGQFARPAAETALAGLLALQRGLDELIPAQRDRRWICLDVRPRMRLLHGCRAIVLGAGTIGNPHPTQPLQNPVSFQLLCPPATKSTPGRRLRAAADASVHPCPAVCSRPSSSSPRLS